MRYEALRPKLSAQITHAGSDVQRHLALQLSELITEHAQPDRANEALAALHAHRYGDSELRTWLRQQAASIGAAYDRLQREQDETGNRGEPWPADKDARMENLHQTATRYEVLHAALDDNADFAAQECAFLARGILSDDGAETAVGWTLRDAGYDVSHTVFWLPPMTDDSSS